MLIRSAMYVGAAVFGLYGLGTVGVLTPAPQYTPDFSAFVGEGVSSHASSAAQSTTPQPIHRFTDHWASRNQSQ